MQGLQYPLGYHYIDLQERWQKDWVVHCKPAVHGTRTVLNYLARYIHRVAIAQAVPNQIWASRPDGFLDWFNAALHAYTGKTEEELAEAALLVTFPAVGKSDSRTYSILVT